MLTQSHLIIGLAAFGKPDAGKVTAAALAGAMLPDLSLYLMAGTHLLILGTDPNVVFGEMYFSEDWHRVFRVDNSIILWGVGLGLALAVRSAWAIALCGAALLHVGLDLALHYNDGRAHFWPITNWIFQSPLSYWDVNHHAGIVGPVENIVSLGLCALIWRRFKGWPMRMFVALLALSELGTLGMWVSRALGW